MRACLAAWIGAALLTLACGQPIAADQASGQGHPTSAASSGHEKEAEPSVFGWALDLGIWTVVVFLVLVWVLSRYAWKPLLEGLQQRETNIRSALEEAQFARTEAERIRGELQAEMNQASGKVRDMLDEARRDAQRATEEMISKARSDIQTERDRLHREIEMARDQALQQIWTQTAQLATLISAKAIRRALNPEDHRRLVDEAIAELREAGEERERGVVGVSS
jgi:F-type H+-transporting ATPase subunit b